MVKVAQENKSLTIPELKERLLAESLDIMSEDQQMSRSIGKYGAGLIENGDNILTHCNAGGLATSDYGTALAVMFSAHEMGKQIHVYADETRPLLQGARLTTWELMRAGIDVTLICDSVAGQVMKEGYIQRVVVGADRIAANGDTANKIGTYMVAVMAQQHGVPFYVAAPTSTVDMSLENGDQIPIEERDSEEVSHINGLDENNELKKIKIVPEGSTCANYAFDVTPAKFITKLITEKGVIDATYESINNLK